MSKSHLENTMNKKDEIPDDKKDDDVRSESSDESISTEDLNILQNQVGETFKKEEEPEEKEIEEVKPDKPKKLSKKELQDLLKEYDNIEEPKQLEEEPPVIKKKKGRPKLSNEEKNAKKTIIKEKVIYMVKDDNTDEYKPVKNPKPLSKRHLKK